MIYNIEFTGRKARAIGVTYKINDKIVRPIEEKLKSFADCLIKWAT